MGKGKYWVSYKEIKQQVSLESVLRRYGAFESMKPAGQSLVSCCPIHKGSNPRQFSVSLEKNLWNCFGNCKAGGNVIDFVAMMEFGNTDPKNTRKAALLLKNWFCPEIETNVTEQSESDTAKPKPEPGKSGELVKKENSDSSVESNPPLKFKLKNLEPEYPFFKERNILPETVQHFGLGFCSVGKTIPGRIAIPIHDDKGRLVAYCGRAVSDEQAKTEGKYKQPANFHKSAVVYNLHRQVPDQKILILVESFISVWKLHQAGVANVVALMGSKLCEPQKELILGYFKNAGGVLLMFDADEDGEKCTQQCLTELSPHLFVKKIDVSPFGRKPHQLSPDQIKSLL